MKKLLAVLVAAFMLTATTALAAGMAECAGNEVKLQIDNPMMNVFGVEKEVDEGRGTAPVIVNDYTLVPIRAVIEAFDGDIYWEAETRTVHIYRHSVSVDMVIDSKSAVVVKDDLETTTELAVAPAIINDRTMVPLRFVSETVGLDVAWDGDERVITISEPKSAPVTFANVAGEFYPIGDLFDKRLGAKDMVVYNHGGEDHQIKTNIISVESVPVPEDLLTDFYDPEQQLSSITVDGEEYSIPNVFNLEYVGVGDLSKNDKGFEVVVVDSGVSDDYGVTVFTYNQYGLSIIDSYSGMTYPYYQNGTTTVWCDGNGSIINDYIGFTSDMYAYGKGWFKCGEDSFVAGGEFYDPDVTGKELTFRDDLFAYYIAVDEYPEDFWNSGTGYSEAALFTVKKGTPVIIDDIIYWYDEETGDRAVMGYYVRIDGKKYVIQLQYAG